MTATACFVGLTILDISGRPVKEIPKGGNVAFVEEIRLNPAGTAAGALMNAAKLGVECSTVACVGEDEKGDFIVDFYKRLGNIDTTMIQRTDEAQTSATILPIRPNGDRPALHCRGASDKLWIEEDRFETICGGDCKVLHYGGIGLLKAMDETSQASKLLQYAQSKGIRTTVDLIAPNESTMDLLKPLLAHVDYFMPSMEEAYFLSGKTTAKEAAQFFLDLGAQTCIFKWGPKGSFVLSKDGNQFTLPAYKIEVKDFTGCGDAYCGGFVAGLCLGMDLKEACQLGTATSALVATGLGSDAGVVDMEQVKTFMKETEVLKS